MKTSQILKLLRSSAKTLHTLLGGLILLAIFTFLILNLDFQSYWIDELWAARVSDPSLSWGETWQHIVSDAHPPLYQILLKVWYSITGWTSTSGRLLSLLFAILATFGFYRLCRVDRNRSDSLLATALFALSWPIMYFALETRSYALLAALSCWALYIVKRILAGEYNHFHGLALIFLTTCGLYTHYFYFIFAFSMGLFFLVELIFGAETDLDQEVGLKILGALLGAVLLFAPWIFIIINQIDSGSGNWIKRPSDLELFTDLLILFGGYVPLIALLALVFFSVNAAFQQGQLTGFNRLCVFSSFMTLALVYLISLAVTPILTHKPIIIIVPGVLYLATLLINSTAHQAGDELSYQGNSSKTLIFGLFAVVLLTVPYETDNFSVQKKQDWRAAVAKAIEISNGGALYTNRPHDVGVYLTWYASNNAVLRGEPSDKTEAFIYIAGHTSVRLKGTYCVLENHQYRRVRVSRLEHKSDQACTVYNGAIR